MEIKRDWMQVIMIVDKNLNVELCFLFLHVIFHNIFFISLLIFSFVFFFFLICGFWKPILIILNFVLTTTILLLGKIFSTFFRMEKNKVSAIKINLCIVPWVWKRRRCGWWGSFWWWRWFDIGSQGRATCWCFGWRWMSWNGLWTVWHFAFCLLFFFSVAQFFFSKVPIHTHYVTDYLCINETIGINLK